ncbi:MAG: hypothetical protein HAW60_03215 [Bdellovibrionales bacterium]|nr:hypothetical protein [Bdellovibrionales bacterium]
MKNILVNTSGRILGPYTAEEVVRNLLEKRFLPIHEILVHSQRWTRISAHPNFLEICSKITDLNIDDNNIEDLTHSLTASFVTSTYINEGDNTGTSLEFDSNTLTVPNVVMEQTKIVKSTDSDEEEEGTVIFFPEDEEKTTKTNVKKQKNSFHSTKANEKTSTKANTKINAKTSSKNNTKTKNQSFYNIEKNKKIKLAIFKLSKPWWIGICVFFFIILALLWQRKNFQIKNNQKLNLALAQKLLNTNQFQESLNLYKQTISLSEANKLSISSNAYENYALLLLLVDQDSFEVKELTNTYLKNSANKKQFLILSYLSSGNNKKALSILKSITNKNTKDWLNTASAHYQAGQYKTSLNILNQLRSKEAKMLSIIIYIKMYKKTLESNWLDKANQTIDIFKNSFYYKQKLSMIKVYIKHLSGYKPSKKDIAYILDQDPYLEQHVKVNLFIYSHLWSWDNLNSYCEKITLASSDKLISSALKVFCLSSGNQKKKNWRVLIKSLDRSKDIIVGSVLAYIYKQEKLMDKYIIKLAHLTESPNARKSLLLLNLELRYCIEKQNKKCIKNRVMDLLNINKYSLFALFHRMKLYQNRGLKKEANKIRLFFKNKAYDYGLF